MSNRQRPASVATAYHEAGHAIAALELGLKLDSATIIPDGTTAGRVSHVCPLRGIRLDMDGSNRARLRAEKAIMVYLAGPAAQRRHRPSSYRHFHAQSDLSNALDLALYLTGSERETRLYLRWLEERTRLLVESPLNWLRIEAVANALLEHGTLRAREIRKVASAALQRAPES